MSFVKKSGFIEARLNLRIVPFLYRWKQFLNCPEIKDLYGVPAVGTISPEYEETFRSGCSFAGVELSSARKLIYGRTKFRFAMSSVKLEIEIGERLSGGRVSPSTFLFCGLAINTSVIDLNCPCLEASSSTVDSAMFLIRVGGFMQLARSSSLSDRLSG